MRPPSSPACSKRTFCPCCASRTASRTRSRASRRMARKRWPSACGRRRRTRRPTAATRTPPCCGVLPTSSRARRKSRRTRLPTRPSTRSRRRAKAPGLCRHREGRHQAAPCFSRKEAANERDPLSHLRRVHHEPGGHFVPAPVRDGHLGAATQRAMHLLSVHRLRAAAGVLVVDGVAERRSPQDGGPQLEAVRIARRSTYGQQERGGLGRPPPPLPEQTGVSPLSTSRPCHRRRASGASSLSPSSPPPRTRW